MSTSDAPQDMTEDGPDLTGQEEDLDQNTDPSAQVGQPMSDPQDVGSKVLPADHPMPLEDENVED